VNADDLTARLAADFRVAHALRNADRPAGLTASRVGGCLSLAARVLLEEPEGSEGDTFRAWRGSALHGALNDMLAEVDPGFADQRGRRFAWQVPGSDLVITGETDFLLDGIPVEMKTRSRNECRWHQDHGAAPDHAMQVSIAASAIGAEQAFVLYLPGEGGLEESAVCEVDVGHWTREAAMWVEQADVRAEVEPLLAQGLNLAEARHRVLDSVPRDMPVRWCLSFCRFVSACRGDYAAPVDLEIPDPTMRAAALEAEHWRQVRLDAARREEAAKAMIRHVDGVVHVTPDEVVKVSQQVVGPTAERRGSKRTVVERRPG